MSNLSTQELMDELKSKIILKLEDNEIACPNCNGLQFTYTQNKNSGIIRNCTSCFGGKLFTCKYCGKNNKTDHCNCEKSEQERNNILNNKESERQLELFNKATKIKFDDYEGRFILESNDFVQDADGIYEWLYDEIKYQEKTDEELPKFIWSTQAVPVFNLDLDEIILDKTEDGYDDMYDNLDMCDDNLIQAQEYLDKWYKNQGDMVNTYEEDYSVAVLLDDLIKEIREDLSNEYIDKLHKQELDTQQDFINSTH